MITDNNKTTDINIVVSNLIFLKLNCEGLGK